MMKTFIVDISATNGEDLNRDISAKNDKNLHRCHREEPNATFPLRKSNRNSTVESIEKVKLGLR